MVQFHLGPEDISGSGRHAAALSRQRLENLCVDQSLYRPEVPAIRGRDEAGNHLSTDPVCDHLFLYPDENTEQDCGLRRETDSMKTVKKLFLGFVLAMVFSVTMIPIIWVFFSSFKSKKELMTKPWSLPEKFLFSNYSNAWQKADFAVLTKNSVTITAFSLLLMLVFATMLAFAISRYKGNLSQVTLIYLLAGQTISAGMIIFPIVIVLRKLGFGSSHAGLILTYAAGGLPFAVFVLQGFFAGIPYELYEAGEIDGAGEFSISLCGCGTSLCWHLPL